MNIYKESALIDIPLLNNMCRAVGKVNMELLSYLEMLEENDEHIIDLCISLAEVISDLTLFVELSVKYRLYVNIGHLYLMI